MTIQIVQVQSGFKADEKDSMGFIMVSFIGCSDALWVSSTICNFKKGSKCIVKYLFLSILKILKNGLNSNVQFLMENSKKIIPPMVIWTPDPYQFLNLMSWNKYV